VNARQLAHQVIDRAKDRGLTVVTAESCTAGRIAQLLADTPGAGEYFHGGFVTYTKQMKTAVLAVSADLMRRQTAVCAEVAQAMAAGALRHSPADLALAVTGVVGPDPDEDGNPVGLVYCAVMKRDRTARVRRLEMRQQDPAAILNETIRSGLELLGEHCAVDVGRSSEA
jgi:nicotinamide-nucleotide amidase